MGITLNLKQVSPYVLEKIKKYPDLAGLFLDAKYLEDSPFWQEFTIIELVRYYQDAAEKGNAMFFHFS
jgi:hypothetical protein